MPDLLPPKKYRVQGEPLVLCSECGLYIAAQDPLVERFRKDHGRCLSRVESSEVTGGIIYPALQLSAWGSDFMTQNDKPFLYAYDTLERFSLAGREDE